MCSNYRDATIPNRQSQIDPAHRPDDEHANFVTHGIGLILALVGSGYLLWFVAPHYPSRTIAACVTYCVSLVGLFAASTLSHTFVSLEWRRFFRTADQCCIFLYIAGAFTPFGVVFLWYDWWPLLLAAMWLLALLGVALVLHMRDLTPRAKVTYGFLGWLPVISLKVFYDAAPVTMLAWILAGGAFYSIGTIFLCYDRRVRFFHALWHTFVIAGTACHYIAIVAFVLQR